MHDDIEFEDIPMDQARLMGRGAWGLSFSLLFRAILDYTSSDRRHIPQAQRVHGIDHHGPRGDLTMAQQPPAIAFEDMSLEAARKMGRGPRMPPELSHALKLQIQSLDKVNDDDLTATRMPLPEGTNPTTMKNRILRVSAELGIPVTVRRVPGGLLFWRSSEEDRQQAAEVGKHLQRMRHQRSRAKGGQRQRPGTRPRTR